ncbi:MAG TPA: FAD-dependent oxidoreductase, partial [Thermoleophilia bacterium]
MNCPRKTLEIAIVGNGAAAAEAVLSMRAAGYQGEIDLFADNPYPPYNPMLGTYYLSGAVAAEQCFPFGDESFYDRNRVRARLGSVVTELDPEARSLATEDGTRYQYRLCLVATGARTACPPLPGLIPDGDGSRVFGLRSFDDAVRL